MKIAVTGAAGYLGGIFARVCEAQGYEVLGLSPETGFWLPDSIPDFTGMDFVVHFAARTPPASPQEFYRVNSEGTMALLNKLVGIKRFVFISTGGVYGFHNGVCKEDDLLMPREFDDYAKSKVEAEDYCKFYSRRFPITIARLFFPFGNDDRIVRLVNRLADNIVNSRPIELNYDARPCINPVHVSDLNDALLKIVEEETAQYSVYNVAGADVVNIQELSELIGEILGCNPVYEETRRNAGDLVGDITKITSRFKWKPMPLKQALEKEFKKGGLE